MPNRRYLPYLDSVRGIAALVVFTVHFGGGYAQHFLELRGTPFSILIDGKAAVAMFFVLSGLVLSLNAFHPDDHLRIVPFYVRRFFRISVPFFFVICLSYGAWKIGWVRHDTNPAISGWLFYHWKSVVSPDFLSILRQAALVVPKTPQTLIFPAWTLIIEMQMSLLLPFLILICKRSGVWLVLFSLVFTTILDGSIYLIHFSCGVLLGRYHVEIVAAGERMHLLSKAVLLAIGLVLITVGNPFFDLQERLGKDLRLALPAVGATCWLVVFSGSPRARAILGRRALRFLGRVSYSFYICHCTVLITLIPFVIMLLNRVGLSGLTASWLAYPLSIGVTVVISWGLYEVVEKPSIRAGRMIVQKLPGNGPGRSPSA